MIPCSILLPHTWTQLVWIYLDFIYRKVIFCMDNCTLLTMTLKHWELVFMFVVWNSFITSVPEILRVSNHVILMATYLDFLNSLGHDCGQIILQLFFTQKQLKHFGINWFISQRQNIYGVKWHNTSTDAQHWNLRHQHHMVTLSLQIHQWLPREINHISPNIISSWYPAH